MGGTVDEFGNFQIKNVPFGEYQVWVCQKPSNDPNFVLDTRIPKKYRRKETSEVTVSVETADEVVLNIKMD